MRETTSITVAIVMVCMMCFMMVGVVERCCLRATDDVGGDEEKMELGTAAGP